MTVTSIDRREAVERPSNRSRIWLYPPPYREAARVVVSLLHVAGFCILFDSSCAPPTGNIGTVSAPPCDCWPNYKPTAGLLLSSRYAMRVSTSKKKQPGLLGVLHPLLTLTHTPNLCSPHWGCVYCSSGVFVYSVGF